ncbi:MAG: 2-amino-4-hydroxy-6-hydroxymethyldihydropteridine diphosphokinase [Endomicrobiales bacterium]
MKKSRGSTTVYLGIGSNKGNRAKNIETAIREIALRWPILRRSSLYLTSPVGPRQRDFVNTVISIDADSSPRDVLLELKDIERALGRCLTDTKRWGPRVIDIDILLWARKMVRTPTLTIPHREMLHRRFVLEALAEIAPRSVHPVAKKTMALLCNELRKRCPDQKVVVYE